MAVTPKLVAALRSDAGLHLIAKTEVKLISEVSKMSCFVCLFFYLFLSHTRIKAHTHALKMIWKKCFRTCESPRTALFKTPVF